MRDVAGRVIAWSVIILACLIFWLAVVDAAGATPTPGTLKVKVVADCQSDTLTFKVKSTIPVERRTEAEVASNILYVTKHNGRHKSRILFHPESLGSWSVPNDTTEKITVHYPNGLPAEAVLQVVWHLAHKERDRTVEAWFEYETHCAPVERRDIICLPSDPTICLLPPTEES